VGPWGLAKADVMAARVRDINPGCDVRVINDFVSGENVEDILGLSGPGIGGGGGGGDDSRSAVCNGSVGVVVSISGGYVGRGAPTSSPAPCSHRRRRRPDFVLDAIDSERDKAAVAACCVHHRVPVMVTGGAGGVDAMGDCLVEDLSTAKFNRLLQRVRRILRREYAFPKGESRYPDGGGGRGTRNVTAGKEGLGSTSESESGSKSKSKSKRKARGGKFGVKCVYTPENANFFKAAAGVKGRGGIGCDGVGGSAVFVTGALGFKAASHIVLHIMGTAGDDAGDPAGDVGGATAGWRSRVWPIRTHPEEGEGEGQSEGKGEGDGEGEGEGKGGGWDGGGSGDRDGGGGRDGVSGGGGWGEGGGNGGGNDGGDSNHKGGGNGKGEGRGEGERIGDGVSGMLKAASATGVAVVVGAEEPEPSGGAGAAGVSGGDEPTPSAADDALEANDSEGASAAFTSTTTAAAARTATAVVEAVLVEAAAAVASTSASSSVAAAAAAAVPAHELFDAHCHWHLNSNSSAFTVSLARSLSGAAFTSTQPPDWTAAVAAAAAAAATAAAATACAATASSTTTPNDLIAAAATDIVAATSGDGAEERRPPGFGLALGLHPWWAHLHPVRTDPVWLETLRSHLLALPAAIVGEIGLDRVAVPMDDAGQKTGEPDYQNQLECFHAQLALAAELERPIAMHCVKAYGDVGDIFRARETMPPRVLMHSYGGTAAFLVGLTRMKRWGARFYFGFSAVVNLRSPKTAAVIRAVPADRLVIESDLVSPHGAEADLRTMLAFVAEARGWSVADAARITRENAHRFYAAQHT